MNKVVQLSDVIAYCECPLKYYFSKDRKIVGATLDDRLLITSALRDTFIKYLHMIGSGRTSHGTRTRG